MKFSSTDGWVEASLLWCLLCGFTERIVVVDTIQPSKEIDMAKKAQYIYGCLSPGDDGCVAEYELREQAEACVERCNGTLMVCRIDKDQDWDEVID